MNFYIKKDHKFLILLIYFNRPKQLRRALQSIREQKHSNWHVALIDDCSDVPGEEIAKEFLTQEEIDKFTFYRSSDTKEIKNERKKLFASLFNISEDNSGAFISHWFNLAMKENKFDIALFLCDDDLLHQDYLENLNVYYNENVEINYSFSHVILFDERYHDWKDMKDYHNRFFKPFPINPYFNLDTSQVSWRSKCYNIDGIKFNEEYHLNFDADWYRRLFQKYGPCVPNGFISQYKNFDKDAFHY